MNIPVIICALAGVVVSVVWGTRLKSNIGFMALIFAFVIGIFMLGLPPAQIYGYWPARTTVQLIIITVFFGFAVENGTIGYIAKWMLYHTRKAPWMIPIVYFALNFAMSAIGVSPPAVNMFLIPIFISLCYTAKVNELFLSVGSNAGGMSGTLAPIGMVGIMLAGIIQSTGVEMDVAGTVSHVFVNAIKVFFLIYLIYYFVLRLFRIKLPEEAIQKPEPLTVQQKRNLCIILVCVLLLFIPAIVQTFAPNVVTGALAKLDISLVYALGIAACVLLKVGNERQVLAKSIPWNVIILLGGMTCLMGVMREAGLAELITGAISGNVAVWLIPVIFVLVSGVLSLFSDGTSVVMPLMIPIAASVGVATDISLPLLFSCVCLPAIGMGMSPFSTGGGVFLSFVREDRFQKMLLQSLVVVLCNLGIMCLLALVGFIN